jgi:hypothetical protein
VRKEGNGLSTFTIIREKTTREIAKIERMSIRDISTILKEEEARRQKNKDQQRQEEVSSNAYKLFSEGKTPIEVAIALNLREPEATKLYREYWKLKRLHKLYAASTELGDEGIGDFLKLHKFSKKEGISREQVINLLQLANEDNALGLSQLEKRHNWLINKIHEFDMQIERSKNYLYRVNNEIANCKTLLNSYHIFCERKRQEGEYLNNEISRLETLVSRFKSNNEEYRKIKQRVEEEVRSVLTDGKVLLQFALASIIEAFRRNPDKYNNVLLYNMPSSSSSSYSLSSLIPISTRQSLPFHIESYKNMIIEISEKLYNILVKELLSRTVISIVDIKTSSYHQSSSPD